MDFQLEIRYNYIRQVFVDINFCNNFCCDNILNFKQNNYWPCHGLLSKNVSVIYERINLVICIEMINIRRLSPGPSFAVNPPLCDSTILNLVYEIPNL